MFLVTFRMSFCPKILLHTLHHFTKSYYTHIQIPAVHAVPILGPWTVCVIKKKYVLYTVINFETRQRLENRSDLRRFRDPGNSSSERVLIFCFVCLLKTLGVQ